MSKEAAEPFRNGLNGDEALQKGRIAPSDELSDQELELVSGGGDQPSDTLDVTGSAKG